MGGISADSEVKGGDAAGVFVTQGYLGDDDLDAHLGEQDVDFSDQFADQAKVVGVAGNDQRVAAILGDNGDGAAELIGGFGGGGAKVGQGNLRHRHWRPA